MVDIRNKNLSLLEKRPDGSAVLRVTFTLRQNAAERNVFPNLRWRLVIRWFSVDGDGDHPIYHFTGGSRVTTPSAAEDQPQQFDCVFDPGELDEDPWWGLGDTKDEIRAQIIALSEVLNVSGRREEYTNTIKEYL